MKTFTTEWKATTGQSNTMHGVSVMQRREDTDVSSYMASQRMDQGLFTNLTVAMVGVTH